MSSLEKGRVKLRAMEPEDLDLLYKVENDTSLWGVGVTNVPYSRYTLHNYIANASSDIYSDKQLRLMVDDLQGNTVGIIDITDFNPRHLRAELGIVIQKKYRRMGYAEAAVTKVVNYCRAILHLHQLYVVVDNDNEAALSFFKKMQFDNEVFLKDWLVIDGKCKNAVLLQYFL